MSKGFILNKYSEKIGEFKHASLTNVGVWNLSDVKVCQNCINISTKTTKEPYLFVLVEQLDLTYFNVVESLGVGFMFSESESWCSFNDMVFKKASFIENGNTNYEN